MLPISHGGGLNGWSAQLIRYVDQRVTVVALHNALPPMPGPLFARVRSVAGGEPGPWGAKYDVADPPATPPAAGPGNAGPGNAGGS